MARPNLRCLVGKIKSISWVRLAIFVLLGVVILQVAVLLQHGSFWSPFEFKVPIVIGAVIGAVFGAFQQIFAAERRQTRDAQAEKEELFKELALSEERLSLATSRSSIWDWNVETDELYMSDGYSASLGYTPEELRAVMRGSMVNLLHPDDVLRYKAKLASHLENPSIGYMNEHRFRTKSGEYRWFLAFGQSVTDDSGKVIRFNGTTTDVSERVDLESRLQQAQKLEAIGKLTGGVAHDFNNLLSIIMGNFDLLRDMIEDQEQIRMVDAGLEATRRGANLTRSMLTFARNAPLRPENLDLNNVVRHAKNWMRRGLPETVEVELSLLAGLWQVRLDAATLENAILNLLINASNAMSDRGKLTIETANIRIDEVYAVSRDRELVPGRYVMLAISDTGTGIPPEILGRIFDPFFTTKGTGKGSGMGLSMVEGFVKQSGGTVQVYTEVGEGTSFKLYFPATDTATDLTPRDAEVAPSDAQGSGMHVLLVEDETPVRDVLATTLKSAGYRVTTAASGDEGLETYQATPKFDLLVTDIVMPGTLQGTGLAKAIKALDPDLPMIFLSGYAAEATVHGNGLRPQDIRLMKPVPKNDLLQAVKKATKQT